MGNTFGRSPKFVSIGYFCGHLVTSVLLIELYPMVPFVPLVLIAQSVYIRTASAWKPATVAEAEAFKIAVRLTAC